MRKILFFVLLLVSLSVTSGCKNKSENKPMIRQKADQPIEKNIVGKEKLNEQAEVIANLTEELDTSDWQTYRNEEYGFELKFPSDYYYSINEYSKNLEISFQHKKYSSGGFEWPRYTVKVFNNYGLSLNKWLQNEWLNQDKGLRNRFKNQINILLINGQQITIDNMEAIKLSLDEEWYSVFITNNHDKTIKLSCIFYSTIDEKQIQLNDICDAAFLYFNFI